MRVKFANLLTVGTKKKEEEEKKRRRRKKKEEEGLQGARMV